MLPSAVNGVAFLVERGFYATIVHTMLEYNQITPRKYIILDGDPYEVLDSHVSKKQQRKPVNQTKVKHLKTGKVVERTFHHSDKVNEADIDTRDAIYIFSKKGDLWFHAADDKSNRVAVPDDVMGEEQKFLKNGMRVKALVFEDEVIGVQLPIKVELEVAEAPPAIKGNTAQGGTKLVTLETGAEVTAPLFVNMGDIVRVNTQTGEYTERVEKK